MELLEHVPDPASLVAACATLVKPGGSVVFSTINRTPTAFVTAILGAEYLTGLVPPERTAMPSLFAPQNWMAGVEQPGCG